MKLCFFIVDAKLTWMAQSYIILHHILLKIHFCMIISSNEFKFRLIPGKEVRDENMFSLKSEIKLLCFCTEKKKVGVKRIVFSRKQNLKSTDHSHWSISRASIIRKLQHCCHISSSPYFSILAQAKYSRYARSLESRKAGNSLIPRFWFSPCRVEAWRHDRIFIKVVGFSGISVLTNADYYAVGLGHRHLLEQADATAVATFRLANSRLALLVEEARLVYVCR